MKRVESQAQCQTVPRFLGETSPELALLLASICGNRDTDYFDLLLRQINDWSFFLALVQRHRVVSLVTQRLSGIRGVPSNTIQVLQQCWRRHTATGLLQIAEARRLTALMEAEGIACLVLKGAPLSVRIYGQPTLRDARDVDFLIAPHSLRRAEAILETAGLRMIKPVYGHGVGRALFLRYSHEYLLAAPSGVMVEVKTRLQPTQALLPLQVSAVLERRVRTSVLGLDIPTLADEDLLLYLCGHGARHCWFRLKWLADIAGLLVEYSSDDLNNLLSTADRLGFKVPVLEALALAHDWLGSDVPEAVLRLARGHPMVQRRRPMVEAAVLETAAMPFRVPGFERMVDRSEYLLRGELRYRAAVLERHLMTRANAVFRRSRVVEG